MPEGNAMTISRRDAFRCAGAALLLTRADAEVTPDVVQFRPEMEPLVRLMESTPRERCAEMVVAQLRRGVSYRQLLGALFLAGIRNVNPRPPGFALHCVFIIHSSHLLGLEAPSDSRLLPLFYALDDFKASQDRDARAPVGDYTMRPLRGSLPAPDRAAGEFTAAMEAWDFERAERAAASLARLDSPTEAFRAFWRYGARDYRNIGHKAIYVANACRTLQTIGWPHAEPVLRSIAVAQLDFGKTQTVNGYALEDQVYWSNLKRLKDGPGKSAPNTRALVEAIRKATPDEACAAVGKASAETVWDAVHLAAAELRMRAERGAALASIHGVTSANALHYAYQMAPDPELRRLLMLQGVGWMAQFRTFAGAKPENLKELDITTLEPAAPDLPAAIRHTVAKADEVHYYKYLAALIEDVPQVSAEWQPHMRAAVTFYTKGEKDPEPAWLKRARAALA
jgi:hypothetical protein